jgi:hypothetical protein
METEKATIEIPQEGKEISFTYKGEEHTAHAKKDGDSFYKILNGDLSGKRINVINLIVKTIILFFSIALCSCDTSEDDMKVEEPPVIIDSFTQKAIAHLDENNAILDSLIFYAQKRIDFELLRDQYSLMAASSRNEVFLKQRDIYIDSALYYNKCIQNLNTKVQARLKK